MKENPDPDKGRLWEIRLTNLLSFGPETETLPLERLNVFIGPQGAGKSNLIEALALMRATPVLPQANSSADVRSVVRRGRGASGGVCEGRGGGEETAQAAGV